MQMFESIKAHIPDNCSDKQLAEYLQLIIDGKAGDGTGKIYGLGHAVYTTSDPRALLVKEYSRDMAEKTGAVQDFELMERIERIGLELLAQKLPGHKVMCANIDMYSGLVYSMLGIPQDMFTPLFAIARVEELIAGGRLIRPGYKAVMQMSDYVPIEERA